MNWASMDPVTLAAVTGLAVLSLGVLICFVRLAIGPTLPDRAIALDMIAILLVGMLTLHGVAEARAESLRVAIVLALVNFLGTIAFAVYIRRKVFP